ncbi:MAG TPA: hypothetical protein VGO11_00460 [Chthoniobacteraceae bacterium]|nr:hypothetical protein [Chthoniobacteraceae bacterium]
MRSPHHAWMGLLTLGAGFMAGHALPLIAGATAYIIGWIYAPDTPLFRGWVDRRGRNERNAAEQAKVAEFVKRRENLLNSLAQPRRLRYFALAEVCRDIESASSENPLTSSSASTDPRLRKLDELMWTYLRLLTIEESLQRFLETERREDLPALVQQAEGEIAQLRAEAEKLKALGENKTLETKQRFFSSRQDRLEVLHRRLERSAQARENVALVVAEQERLDQQIKLIRADAVAMKNAGALTERIDATVEHLDQTNKWLAEMDDFKDLVGDLPQTEARLGFSSPPAPPPLGTAAARARARGRVS